MSIWIYRLNNIFIAKLTPFSMYKEIMDNSGNIVHEIIQGTAIPLPPAWDWQINDKGRIFAGLNNFVYDITDIVYAYYPCL